MKTLIQNLFLLLFISSCSLLFERNTDRDFQVKANAGTILGIDEGDHYSFKGIPYAQPPVGDLRWRAPKDLPRSSEPIFAVDYKSSCVQPGGGDFNFSFTREVYSGDEDCLYLNIFVPQNQTVFEKNNFPVMFWIHGGANIYGAGSDYDFSKLATSQQVIIVTMNYRLGLFGWFTSEHLKDTSEGLDKSSNFGQLDIIKALEWVQSNIDYFGGDSSNVTIFGESAGGHNILTLLASPLGKGLFHRAISQSGYIESYSLVFAKRGSPLSSEKLFEEDIKSLINSEDIAQKLREIPAGEIYERVIKISQESDWAEIPKTTRDGIVVPLKGLYSGLRDVDPNIVVVAGTNRDELNYYFIQSEYFYDTTFDLKRSLKRSEENLKSWIKYRSEIWRFRGAEEPLRAMSKNNNNLYSYRFDWDEEANSNLFGNYQLFLGAPHGMDIPFVSGEFDLGPINFYIKPIIFPSESEEGRLALNELMMKYWANIAKYGDPNAFLNGPKWEKFSKDKQQFLILDNPIDNELSMVQDPVDIDVLLSEVESDSSLEIAERCIIGWIAANERNELKQANSLADISDPPYSFCSNFEKEYLIRLFNKVDGRD